MEHPGRVRAAEATLLESIPPFSAILIHTQAQRLGVTQRNLPANNAALLELFDAVPDGRLMASPLDLPRFLEIRGVFLPCG